MESAWHLDIKTDEYHHGEYKDYISSTDLKNFIRSPAHYRCYKDEPKESTPAMIFGSAFHSVALGFPDEVVVIPEINRRTKVGKAEWTAFQDNNHGKYMIKADEMKHIKGMMESISHHKHARKIMESKFAQFEISGLFEDFGTDLKCKIRPDILDLDSAVIADLKTCIDASYDIFNKTIFNYGYHFQSMWYRYGGQMIEGCDFDFIFIAVEKTPPYGVNTVKMAGRGVMVAEQKIFGVMGDFADCMKEDIWPCYEQKIYEPDALGWITTD